MPGAAVAAKVRRLKRHYAELRKAAEKDARQGNGQCGCTPHLWSPEGENLPYYYPVKDAVTGEHAGVSRPHYQLLPLPGHVVVNFIFCERDMMLPAPTISEEDRRAIEEVPAEPIRAPFEMPLLVKVPPPALIDKQKAPELPRPIRPRAPRVPADAELAAFEAELAANPLPVRDPFPPWPQPPVLEEEAFNLATPMAQPPPLAGPHADDGIPEGWEKVLDDDPPHPVNREPPPPAGKVVQAAPSPYGLRQPPPGAR